MQPQSSRLEGPDCEEPRLLPHPDLVTASFASDGADVGSAPTYPDDQDAGDSDRHLTISIDGTIHAGAAEPAGKLVCYDRKARRVDFVFGVDTVGVVRLRLDCLSDLIEQRR